MKSKRTILLLCLAIGATPRAWMPAQSPAQDERKAGREATPAVVNPPMRSALRDTIALDGSWDFAIDPKLQGEAEKWYVPGTALPASRKIAVPGCWEAQGVGAPGLSSADTRLVYEPVNVKLRAAYRGAAWYKRQFTVPADWSGKQIWLKIGGVNSQGWFWVNGRYVGHDLSYCGTWKYNITDLVAPGGKATIAALVRNDVPSRRGESNCVRMYGGLFRSVEIEATPAVLIDNVYAEPRFADRAVRLHITLRNTTGAVPGKPYRVEMRAVPWRGCCTPGEAARDVALGPGPTTDFMADVPLGRFTPWSPENPFLYIAEVELYPPDAATPIDGWIERFGMKQYEVRDGDLHLNGHRYFVRATGDDHVYPMTVCSPASREEHARHLRIVKQYGFNYMVHHTHCEVPEYYQAADEVGIMIQPELPYYGGFGPDRPYAHLSGAPLMGKDDLAELVAHCRRFVSLTTYCGGNEGVAPTPLDRELHALANRLDPTRPYVSLDGGNNSRENSDVNNYWGGGMQTHPAVKENVWPHVLHEYMSLGLNEDPRIEPKFTGAFMPNLSLTEVKRFVTKDVGLDWHWAEACFDAGYRLQGIHHKIGIETARIDPPLDGFVCWLMIDISPSSQNGILNMFWEPKHSTPEYFRQFNSPTVVLARTTDPASPEALSLNPAKLVYASGDLLEVDWLASHFQSEPLAGATLSWRVAAGDHQLDGGRIEDVKLGAGDVRVVGRSRMRVPALEKAVLATLAVELQSPGNQKPQARNSWKLWLVPKFRPRPDCGSRLAASAGAFDLLAPRYPGLAKLGSPAAADRAVLVAKDLAEPGVLEALEQGKSVVALSLPGFNVLRPGVSLGWWQITNQTGTAIAQHPAFGDFPHEGFLDQGWFRLVDTAERLDPGHQFRTVEPLMSGIGRETGYAFGTAGYPLGFNLYAFQARTGQGKLLSTGLNLSSDYPEAIHLLNQFIRYALSPQFQPQGTFDLAGVREKIRRHGELLASLNGWSATLETAEKTDWHSFLRTAPMYIARQLSRPGSVAWKTRPWRADSRGQVTFRWIANLGWQSQPAGGHFTFYLDREKLFDFDITLKSQVWTSADGSVTLRYTVKSIDRNEDSSGIMELSVPASRLPPGGEPAVLRVSGSGPESRRYFAIQEPP